MVSVGRAKPVKIPVEADTKSAEASAKRLTDVMPEHGSTFGNVIHTDFAQSGDVVTVA